MSKVIVIGGGISGLTLAYRLEQLAPSAEVVLFERRSRTGGVVDTIERDGFRVETGPNGFLDNNPATMMLCRELNLANRLIPASESARRNRFLFLDGQLRALPSSLWSFLTGNVLSWRGKLALLTERFRRRRLDLADESIEDFARRRTNDEIAKTLVDAFVTGIHAGDPGLLSIRAALPRLASLERQYGSVTRGMSVSARQRRKEARARGETPTAGMRMWSFPEGLGLLVETLHQKLRRPPITGVTVKRIEKTASGWLVIGEGQDRWPADAVALTCPAYHQAALLADIDPLMADEVDRIAYNRIVVVAVGYRRQDVPYSLDGFGYLSPGRQRRDVLGVQWCSSIFPGRAPEGCVLLRALCGGWHRAEMVDWDDARLLGAVRNELRLTVSVTAEPGFHHIVRWERAIPQYHVGHLERVAHIEQLRQHHRGLHLGGNAYRGVSLNDCVEQASVLAREILSRMEAGSIL
jgi:oxygen-dependent protoporphyrinogen oxidase